MARTRAGKSTAKSLERLRGSRAGAPAILLTNISQLCSLSGASGNTGPRRGKALADLQVIEDAAVLCVGGKIVAVGKRRESQRDSWIQKHKKQIRVIDCRGGVVLPGFVDSHTHPVFANPRLIDFEKRISGASYEQIAEAGGGIRSSVEGVRKATRKQLAEQVFQALTAMAAEGTTTVEAKSGYGLSFEAEMKSLEAIRDAAKQWEGTVVPTLLGAHTVPSDFRERRQDYVALVRDKMIPEAARRKLAQYVDVFCERGAFTMSETEEIFAAAKQYGLGTRAHVCQLSDASLSPLGRFHSASYDHLDRVTDVDMDALALKDTVATLLPGANYFLGLREYPPARRLIEAGVAVALATDYNPGTSPTASMPFVLSLSCTQMKMSAAEAITAATYNGACALQLAHRKGSIEPGKDADLAIFDASDYCEIAYWVAGEICSGVVANGALIPAADSHRIEFE